VFSKLWQWILENEPQYQKVWTKKKGDDWNEKVITQTKE
jgi:hypothetical protein